MSYADQLTKYDALVAACPDFPRKGKTMPYTSANGHMFSLLNKAAEIGIRFDKARQQELMEQLDTTEFHSYGAVMRGYIKIPQSMLDDRPDEVIELLKEGHAYVMSLPPK